MNDMMIAALQKQRQGKMDSPASPPSLEPKKGGSDLEARISELEDKYDKLCEFVGMNEGPEESKEQPSAMPPSKSVRGY